MKSHIIILSVAAIIIADILTISPGLCEDDTKTATIAAINAVNAVGPLILNFIIFNAIIVVTIVLYIPW